jgi:BTB And C-terminal Kelch
MKDHKFSEVSRDDVITLLQRDDLSVKSEVELFDAIARWGLKQVTKANQKPTPELIRQMLGPSIIKSIRFLTMSGAEYSRIHLSSKILDYAETLAVLLNINSPGGVDMPSTLSPSTQKRKARLEGPGTFYSVSPKLGKCNDTSEDSSIYSTLYTTTFIPNRAWTIEGIQIPKSLEARSNCSLNEHFDVLILDSSDNVVTTYTYDQVPPCTTPRYKFESPGTSAINYDDNTLIKVPFKPSLSISKVSSEADRYKMKIVYYVKREYPKWVDAGAATSSASNSDEYSHYRYFYILHKRPFVYSYFTYTEIMRKFNI